MRCNRNIKDIFGPEPAENLGFALEDHGPYGRSYVYETVLANPSPFQVIKTIDVNLIRQGGHPDQDCTFMGLVIFGITVD